MSDLNVYTTSQINALTPITGDLVVDSDLNAVKLYNGSAWKTFTTDGTSIPYQNRWGASFDGSNDYLDCGTLSALNSATDFSVSMWVNFQSFVSSGNSSYNIFLMCGTGTTDRFALNAVSSTTTTANTLEVYFCEATASIVGTSLGLTTNTWYHMAVYKNGSNMSFYINNTLIGSRNNAPTSGTATGSNLKIGRGIYGGLYSSNILADEVAVFDAALSAADITKIYNSGVPTDLTKAVSYDTDRTANLKGYWKMGDDSNDSATAGGSIATITDSSGNGHDATQGTASSQPTFSDLTGETIYV
jgi:hypothetical protein